MKKIVILLFSALLLTTCKKSLYKVELSGRVLDEFTGKPIEGVKVHFLGGNTSITSSGPGYYDKEVVTTDSDGSYVFKFNVNDNDAFALSLEYDKDHYIDAQSDRPLQINLQKKIFKEKIKQDLYLKRYSILNVKFKQTTFDTVLVFSIIPTHQKAILKWMTGTGAYFPAYNAEIQAHYLYYGDTEAKIRFTGSLKSDPNSIYKDTVYTISIPKNSEVNYQINY